MLDLFRTSYIFIWLISKLDETYYFRKHKTNFKVDRGPNLFDFNNLLMLGV